MSVARGSLVARGGLAQGGSLIAPPAGVSISNAIPDPENIEKQKEVYLKVLESQLVQGLQALDIQLKQQQEAIQSQASQQKNAFNLQVDMEVRAQEIFLQQQYDEQHMLLQQQVQQQKTSLEQQAMQLIMEYQQKKAEEELQKQQLELEREQHQLQMKLQHEFQQMQTQLITDFTSNFAKGFTFAPNFQGVAPNLSSSLQFPANASGLNGSFNGTNSNHENMQTIGLSIPCLPAASHSLNGFDLWKSASNNTSNALYGIAPPNGREMTIGQLRMGKPHNEMPPVSPDQSTPEHMKFDNSSTVSTHSGHPSNASRTIPAGQILYVYGPNGELIPKEGEQH